MSCAVRTPPYVIVPRATSRSEEPVRLPLDPEGRARLEAFLSRGGHPKAVDSVPDPRAIEHARTLDALEQPAALLVTTTDSTVRRFCDEAVNLCARTTLFRGQPFVRQVIDARESRRPVTAPLATPDGGYWWIFQVKAGRLSEVLLVCAVDQGVER
jgi:hypothetical protein